MKIRLTAIVVALICGISIGYAKGYKQAKVYMFGFAASFNDSTVYITRPQLLDAYLYNDRTHFLADRENYSFQLKSYLQNNNLSSFPTCITIYATSEKAIQKKYLKLKAQYEKIKNKYIIKEIETNQFAYKTITPTEDNTTNQVITKQE